MDFFEQQARVRRQSRLLIWLFGLAVIVVLVLNYFIFGTLVLVCYKPLPHFQRTRLYEESVRKAWARAAAQPENWIEG